MTGVVTYYFNDNYGDKPDVGAKIFIYKYSKENSIKEQVEKYKLAKMYNSTLSLFKKKDPKREEYENKLKEMGINSKEDFDNLDSETATEIMKLDLNQNKGVKKITVDGNGKYSIDLEPGLYEIVLISMGRTDMTVSEIHGMVELKEIEIKSNETTSLDCRFTFSYH